MTTSRSRVENGEVVTVTENLAETFTCMASSSNPAPAIYWRMGSRSLNMMNETSTLEASKAVLIHSFSREDTGARLECVVEHDAYQAGQKILSIVLDVMYRPSVTIAREESPVLEDGEGRLSLSCNSDANPQPRIVWRKGEEIVAEGEILDMDPVVKEDAGIYVCQAENRVGVSEPESTEVKVIYGPRSVTTQPLGSVHLGLSNSTVLSCYADSEPAAEYFWLQRVAPDIERRKGVEGETLLLERVGYDDQGEYTCV